MRSVRVVGYGKTRWRYGHLKYNFPYFAMFTLVRRLPTLSRMSIRTHRTPYCCLSVVCAFLFPVVSLFFQTLPASYYSSDLPSRCALSAFAVSAVYYVAHLHSLLPPTGLYFRRLVSFCRNPRFVMGGKETPPPLIYLPFPSTSER